MLTNLPSLKTVTALLRVRRTDGAGGWARDQFGNAVYDVQRVDVPGCSVQPSSSSESTDSGRDRVSTSVTIYAPAEWPAEPLDAVEIDGVRHDIDGRPQRWDHPRLGHVVITAREVTG